MFRRNKNSTNMVPDLPLLESPQLGLMLLLSLVSTQKEEL